MELCRYFTQSDLEVLAVSADQMREVDRIAVEESGPNLYQMMENAGRSFALEVIDTLEQNWKSSRILILAGSGGNGGGICAGRHLLNRNLSVTICFASTNKLISVSAYQRSIFLSANGLEITADLIGQTSPNIIVDALIGYSLREKPNGTVQTIIDWTLNSGIQVISLDIPSGCQCDHR